MALRDQPYIPLYVQDIMTDEKLNECTAATHGIYIKGVMCLMHKSEYYGKILLKQKYKEIASKENDKAYGLSFQLDKHLPYTQLEIYSALRDLEVEKVCYWEGDFFCQKRMITDNELSLKRAKSGKKGGEKTQENNKEFAKANKQASSENEYVIDNEIEINESVIKTIDFISKKFGITEMNHFLNYRLIYNCSVCQYNLGEEKFKHFKDQCWNYFIYKDLAKEKLHAIKTFIGTPEEQYLDGGWNAENWIKKHTDIKNKEKGIESTIYPSDQSEGKKYPSVIKTKSEPDLLKQITEKKS